jgi:20S proteasome subunit alpha 4
MNEQIFRWPLHIGNSLLSTQGTFFQGKAPHRRKRAQENVSLWWSNYGLQPGRTSLSGERTIPTLSELKLALQKVFCSSEAWKSPPTILQVEYAMEAVRKGTLAVGVCGSDCVVLGVEKKSTAKLQDPRTMRKIQTVDDKICVAFAGLTADARILINRARTEAQSHKLTLEDNVSVEYMSRYIGGVQQKYTQSGGVRPFGLSTLIAGLSPEGKPQLFHTDPSGTYSEWQANATGRNSKVVREWLERHYAIASGHDVVKLALRALLELVEPASKNIEIAIVAEDGLSILSSDAIDSLITEVEGEKVEVEKVKKETVRLQAKRALAAAAASSGLE